MNLIIGEYIYFYNHQRIQLKATPHKARLTALHEI
ncbi:MAG: hypothetical protein IKL31_00225 [Ruminococcus sp.]|nr:hypothetical protein [Ruminococcus sp.]